MKTANIYNSKNWFEVLQTAKKSQTAVMTLKAGGSSSEDLNTHEHSEHSEQIVLLLEGEIYAEVEGQKFILHEGDTCIIAAGAPHRLENKGSKKALTFNVYSPPEYPPDEKD